jgi:hypothetical protein
LRERTGEFHKFILVQTKTIDSIEFHQCIRTPQVGASGDTSGNSTKNCKFHLLLDGVVVFGELGWLPSDLAEFAFLSSVTHTVRYTLGIDARPIALPGHAKLQFRAWHINKTTGIATPK